VLNERRKTIPGCAVMNIAFITRQKTYDVSIYGMSRMHGALKLYFTCLFIRMVFLDDYPAKYKLDVLWKGIVRER